MQATEDDQLTTLAADAQVLKAMVVNVHFCQCHCAKTANPRKWTCHVVEAAQGRTAIGLGIGTLIANSLVFFNLSLLLQNENSCSAQLLQREFGIQSNKRMCSAFS